jgi:hypothetical protein
MRVALSWLTANGTEATVTPKHEKEEMNWWKVKQEKSERERGEQFKVREFVCTRAIIRGARDSFIASSRDQEEEEEEEEERKKEGKETNLIDSHVIAFLTSPARRLIHHAQHIRVPGER